MTFLTIGKLIFALSWKDIVISTHWYMKPASKCKDYVLTRYSCDFCFEYLLIRIQYRGLLVDSHEQYGIWTKLHVLWCCLCETMNQQITQWTTFAKRRLTFDMYDNRVYHFLSYFDNVMGRMDSVMKPCECCSKYYNHTWMH